MPDPKPQMVYGHMTADRDIFLGYAEDVARLCAPQLAPRGEEITERPWTSDGISGVRSLASKVMKIIWPVGVPWGRIDLPKSIWTELDRQVAAKEVPQQIVLQLKEHLKTRSLDMIATLNQKKARSRFGRGLLRNIIEGNTGVRNSPEGLTIFPLRSIVVKRNEHGEVAFLGIEENDDPDLMAVQEDSDFDVGLTTWTLIDYEEGEIWRQVEDGDPFRVEDEDPAWYFVFTPEIPDVGDYSVGYAWNYLRLITQLDHAESSLAEAMAFASWKPVGLREGSSLAQNPDRLTKRKSGQPVLMQDGDIIWPDASNKLSEWGFVAAMRNDDKAEAASAFAKGLKDRPISKETSATAILQLIDEINEDTADFLGGMEDTGQRPLLASESRLHDLIRPLFSGDALRVLGPHVQTIVTTGLNALEKQRALNTFMLRIMPVVKTMDETVVYDGVEMLDRAGEGQMIDTEGLYRRQTDQEKMIGMLSALPPSSNGQSKQPREETIRTRGGPQPPQGAPPSPGT